ncbi:hypothetical protein ACFOEE_09335 [Pseudoalteromonas fenneropenaei]|uniref:Uncharacterized protein n=1 Tax=Pseudoalteromonas fenneropenaei TaxID=1737459 RepID=A0ABV7CJN8_9GAMM
MKLSYFLLSSIFVSGAGLAADYNADVKLFGDELSKWHVSLEGTFGKEISLQSGDGNLLNIMVLEVNQNFAEVTLSVNTPDFSVSPAFTVELNRQSVFSFDKSKLEILIKKDNLNDIKREN